MTDQLIKKVDRAIRLLRNIPQDGPIEVSYSGGKDSDVILELVKMAGIPYEAIYKNTTIDPPGTIKHCKDNGVTVLNPKRSFLQIVEKNGLPTRWARFCCTELKEYKIHDRAIHGIRREESTKRARLYKEPEACRKYRNGTKVRVYLPILEWTIDDVATFLDDRKVHLAPWYYDKLGKCHYERRLGCLGCPLAGMKSRRRDFTLFPKLLRLIIRSEMKYMGTHPDAKVVKLYGDAYNKMFGDLFIGSCKDAIDFFEGRIFPFDSKEYMEDYFNIDLSV